MSSELAIRIHGLSKCYTLFDRPSDRLKQMLFRGRRKYYREFWALRDVGFELRRGEVLGVIGRNGAGKSTLLQLICGTQTPTTGEVEVHGRVAALLELGAGFNLEFTGRENIFLSASILGLSNSETQAHLEEIIEFSGIRPFIDQPVKTYSSGMYMRLAFSVAISVEPDILVIDEALAVGDSEFSRKSFDRIMALKEAGKTILFCSHSLYQVEAICNRAIWLDRGGVQKMGEPADVIVAYNAALNSPADAATPMGAAQGRQPAASGTARIVRTSVSANGVAGQELHVQSGTSSVTIDVEFASDPALPVPSVAVMFTDKANTPIASAGTRNDGLGLSRDANGNGRARVVFEHIPLLKGSYWVYAFLMCENAVHFYDYANMVAQLNVTQKGLEMGIVSLPHRWE